MHIDAGVQLKDWSELTLSFIHALARVVLARADAFIDDVVDAFTDADIACELKRTNARHSAHFGSVNLCAYNAYEFLRVCPPATPPTSSRFPASPAWPALGMEEVAAVAGLHLHAVADASKVRHLYEQNDVHFQPSTVAICEL